MSIYLDNASTSFPKPKEVIDAMTDYMINIGGNPGRGSSSTSMTSSHIIYDCREAIADLFNFERSTNVIFTSNITSSLNILINSVAEAGCHIISSVMEHNSVLRPLYKLKENNNIDLTLVGCNNEGYISADEVIKAVKQNTKLIVLSHGSNVTGCIQDLYSIGNFCKNNNILFIVDTAQTAGCIDIDFNKLNCNALAFTGHKGLMGPQGIGGFIIDDKMNEVAAPVFVGGTGSMSSSLIQPDFLPDKFESGTLNIPGIAGLNAAINFINKVTIKNIYEKEMYLSKTLLEYINNMDYLTLYGPNNINNRLSTFSINMDNIASNELSYYLDSKYNIITRTGLHCAPLAHKAMKTDLTGSVRISLGYYNTEQDIKLLVDALHKIHKGV